MDAFREMAYPETATLGPPPIPLASAMRIELFHDLSDDVVGLGLGANGLVSGVEFRHWGGAPSRPDGDAGPVGHRDAPFSVVVAAMAEDGCDGRRRSRRRSTRSATSWRRTRRAARSATSSVTRRARRRPTRRRTTAGWRRSSASTTPTTCSREPEHPAGGLSAGAMARGGVDAEPDEDAARGDLLASPRLRPRPQPLAHPPCAERDADVDERVERDAERAEHDELDPQRAVLRLAELRQERDEEQRGLRVAGPPSRSPGAERPVRDRRDRAPRAKWSFAAPGCRARSGRRRRGTCTTVNAVADVAISAESPAAAATTWASPPIPVPSEERSPTSRPPPRLRASTYRIPGPGISAIVSAAIGEGSEVRGVGHELQPRAAARLSR